MVCRALIRLVACVMMLFACVRAPALDVAQPQVVIYCTNLETGTGWSLEPSKPVSCRPRLNGSGTRLYVISTGPTARDSWDVKAVALGEKELGPVEFLARTERRELAVVPSPDEKRLLLMVVHGERVDLIVTGHDGQESAKLAEDVHPTRSRFLWSADGARVYYTVPANGGKRLALRRVTSDGKAAETLIESGVSDFDLSATRERAVALVGSTVQVLDDGEATQRIDLGFRAGSVRLSPDGEWVALGGGRLVVFSLATGRMIAASSSPDGVFVLERHPAWSPKGDGLVFVRQFHLNGADEPFLYSRLVFFSLADRSERLRLQRTAYFEQVQWGSDGRWLVFVEASFDETGGTEALHVDTLPPLQPAPPGAKWTRLDGPHANGVEALAVSTSTTRALYAISRGKFCVSDDRGATWRRRRVIAKGVSGPGHLSHVAVHPGNSRVVYVATTSGVWRSEDGGETWAYYAPDVRQRYFEPIALDPVKPDVVYVLNGLGELVRYDGNATVLVHKFDEEMFGNTLRIDPRRPELFTLTHERRGLDRLSLDAGKTWRALDPPQGEQQIISLVAGERDEGLLLCQTDTHRVFSSRNGGEGWELYADPSEPARWTNHIRRTLEALFVFPARGGERGPAEMPKPIYADPKSPSRLYGNLPGRGLCCSEDGGKSWKPVNEGLGPMHLSTMLPVPDRPGRIVAGGDGWLALSTDGGGSWRFARGPVTRTSPWDIVAHPHVAGLLLLRGEHGGLFRSDDSGESWTRVPGAALGRGMKGGRCFEFDPHKPGCIVAYGDSAVFRSNDGGRRWDAIARFYPPREGYESFLAVANHRVINVGSAHGKRIFQTRDSGKTWRALDGPFRPHGVASMIGRPGSPGSLYVVTEPVRRGGPTVLCVSHDFGDTWETHPLPLLRSGATTLARNPAAPDMLAVGSGMGAVWFSLDDGKHWRDAGAGLPKGRVDALAFSPADSRLYALLKGGGLFWIEVPTL